MSKSFTIVLAITGVMIVLAILGLNHGAIGSILEALGWNNPQDFSLSGLFSSIFTPLALAGLASGIVIGILFSQSATDTLIAGFLVYLGTIVISDMVSLIVLVDGALVGDFSWLGTVIKGIMMLFIIGFGVSLVQFWRGSD